ncbi:trihelix transcription factor ASIL1-like [Populus alba x Populus x berolinensis]|uniref:Trihelix transcription factor ASIL1-like n=1 Tax=Populus alba x Populus x berolinensis TaxID=444605 RepID=A0AAD6WGQ8_9ROSI|nr:trihelix transcription factor ASIL1-like [Populus alba x Populus x berolinensis]
MDDTEDDARYPQNPYGENNQRSYGSNRHKLPVGNATYSRPVDNQYAVSEDEDSDDEEEGEHEGIDDEEEEDDDIERHPKKRKLKSLVSSYEFAPLGGRNPLTDWTEHETFVLLDAWGEKFLQRGKKSLRSDEWQEVAEKVSDKSKIERTDTQCRNRLDTLKKKYKIERIKLAEDGGGASKWVYFKKMDVLMSTSAQQGGLSCGMDSGEYVSMNPRVYSNHSNGLDEMRDSPGNSELARDEDDSDGLPPKKRRLGRDCIEQSSFGLLADSIYKFSEIYEKIENSKRQQMLELEKMRMDFQRDLEMQKRQIIERAQAAIAKIHQVGEEEDSISANSA